MRSSDMVVGSMDLSHHLSDFARSRGVSPLKGLQKYFGRPGLISLAGGLPSPEYFPFESTSAQVFTSDHYPVSPNQQESSFSWFWKLLGVQDLQERNITLQIPKYPTRPADLSLSTALQYSGAQGSPLLQDIIKEFTAKIYKPGFNDWRILVHTGNTDGWAKALITLCNPGEGVLVDKLTYPSAMAAMLPYKLSPIPVAMDNQGTRSDSLREILAQWDEAERNMPRPHVMYTIPVGENPVGVTMSAARKQEIYNICHEYDIIIVEDDPYYFLQLGPYAPKWLRHSEEVQDTKNYLNRLVPSFLRFDTDGRVIRLDSFSKTIAPGVRLGWFTCNPLFAERLERASETSTQAPCGFSQSFVCSLLLEWRFDGYIRWLQSLATQYKNRRDFMLDCIGEDFYLQQLVKTNGLLKGFEVYEAYPLLKSRDVKEKADMAAWFSFVAPTAGMFIWINLVFENHPLFASVGSKTLEMRLWTAIAESGVLFAPGWMFKSDTASDNDENLGHFRISFSNAEYDDMRKAMKIFANVLGKFYRLKA